MFSSSYQMLEETDDSDNVPIYNLIDIPNMTELAINEVGDKLCE